MKNHVSPKYGDFEVFLGKLKYLVFLYRLRKFPYYISKNKKICTSRTQAKMRPSFGYLARIKNVYFGEH